MKVPIECRCGVGSSLKYETFMPAALACTNCGLQVTLSKHKYKKGLYGFAYSNFNINWNIVYKENYNDELV